MDIGAKSLKCVFIRSFRRLFHPRKVIHILDLEIREVLDDLDGVVGEMFDNLPLARISRSSM